MNMQIGIIIAFVVILAATLLAWIEIRARKHKRGMKQELAAEWAAEHRRFQDMMHAFAETTHDHVAAESAKLRAKVDAVTGNVIAGVNESHHAIQDKIDGVEAHVKDIGTSQMKALHEKVDAVAKAVDADKGTQQADPDTPAASTSAAPEHAPSSTAADAGSPAA